MESFHHISPLPLTLQNIQDILSQKRKLTLSEESKILINRCYKFVQDKIDRSDTLYYGINTGFGSLCDVAISNDEIEQLQLNLLQSHACGMGDEVPVHIVQLMMLLKINALSHGYSGVSIELIEQMILLYNAEAYPVVYQQGSLGASGDLAPLAHLALPLVGLGEVRYGNTRLSSKGVYKIIEQNPITLKAKEGLALLNGTEFSTAYGVWAVLQSNKLLKQANLNVVLGVDAFNCRLSPFQAPLHQIRPHRGQIETAQFILDTLADSEIAYKDKVSVQDPYAFRCVPQVHGASADTIRYVSTVISTEISSVTDNPVIFPDENAILSGGNFHAQPIALVLDFLAIAVAELGSISERRVFQLISGKRGLPDFLTPNPGLNSGMMIPQYVAASIVSQNKQYCTPASVDSIVSCNGQEDHVSMAANAATKLYKVIENVEKLLAIEFMTAAQALEFRRPLKTASIIENMIENYRKVVPVLDNDRVLSLDMHDTVTFLRNC
ncbi:MAG: histidine ammonia-lyase [Saprospiraceae bacterium]